MKGSGKSRQSLLDGKVKKVLEIDDEIEKMESEYAGLEYEENFFQDIEDDQEIPFNADKIRIDQQMLSLKYIMELKN